MLLTLISQCIAILFGALVGFWLVDRARIKHQHRAAKKLVQYQIKADIFQKINKEISKSVD